MNTIPSSQVMKMVRKSYNLLDMLDDWSEGRHDIDVYTGAEEPSYSGFIIHVGEDYLAMVVII